MTAAADWATTNGDIWSRRWRDTDAGLEGLSPRLLSAIAANEPASQFRALDVGCGAGTTSIQVAKARPDAAITGCDISASLLDVARQRTVDLPQISLVLGDAEAVASREGPFDLIFSRHGVMFFADPVRAFRSLRSAANPGASLVFSCFQAWESNPWSSELASAAAGAQVPPPGREPSGFAFADPDYVRQIFASSGWAQAEPQPITFQYVAGKGDNAVEDALSFLADIGPAARVVQSMPEEDRAAAIERMRVVIERYFDGATVIFPAAAWIWSARAGPAPV
jgi:ubiquinone/menaquinone biosynthesis C-methylase UbiE